jgi:hypothetical protein
VRSRAALGDAKKEVEERPWKIRETGQIIKEVICEKEARKIYLGRKLINLLISSGFCFFIFSVSVTMA